MKLQLRNTASVALVGPFESAKLMTTYHCGQELTASATRAAQHREAHIQDLFEHKEHHGLLPQIADTAMVPSIAVVVPSMTLAYTGFAALNLIEHKESVAYLVGKVSPDAVSSIKSVPHLGWTAGYFLSSLALGYGAGDANLANTALFNTGIFEARKLFGYIFSSAQDLITTPEKDQSLAGFLYQYADNIAYDLVSTLVQTAAIATLSEATLGLGGLVMPISMTLTNAYIKYRHVYYGDQNDAAADAGKLLPPIAAAASTALYMYAMPAAASTEALSNGLYTAKLALSSLPIFATSYAVANILNDHYVGSPAVTEIDNGVCLVGNYSFIDQQMCFNTEV